MNEPDPLPPSPGDEAGPDATADFLVPATPPATVPAAPVHPAGDEPTSDLVESPTLGADAAFEGGARIGPYRLVRKLGQGGMGTVWEAVHMHLHKAVAVKVLSPRLMKRPEVIARFYQEMRAAGRVTHPNVVQAYDAGEFGGVHFLAMELVDGIDLHRHISRSGPLAPPYAARALRQTALGLAAAHAEGLVHRDMKPMNLLVSRRGRVKILDLGLARVAEAAADELLREGLTAEGHVMGTPDYIAPEQWDDPRTVGPAADLYSLGCTLFFLLTGKPPFGSDRHSSAARKMVAHLSEEPPDLAAVRADVPQELNAIYRRLVAKRPEDRPASASELANMLAPLTVTERSSKETSSRSPGESGRGEIDTAVQVARKREERASLQAGRSEVGAPATTLSRRAASRGKAWAGCFGAVIGCACMALFGLCSIVCIGLAASKSKAPQAEQPRAAESAAPEPASTEDDPLRPADSAEPTDGQNENAAGGRSAASSPVTRSIVTWSALVQATSRIDLRSASASGEVRPTEARQHER